MGDRSAIEWTDATWNPTVGCSLVSSGCGRCYAMRHAARLERMGVPGYHGLTTESAAGPVWTGAVRTASDETFQLPLRWKRPRRVFVDSMSDLFHDGVASETIDRVWQVMAECPQHTFQILTKRPGRMHGYIALRCRREWQPMLDNVWLGVSVEDQASADERIPFLKSTPAARRFVSFEPLLGPVLADVRGIDWAIVGGESGDDARPMHPAWARSLRDQCTAAGVAFFFKQWGAWAPAEGPLDDRRVRNLCVVQPGAIQADEVVMRRTSKSAAGNQLDGRSHLQMPGLLAGRGAAA